MSSEALFSNTQFECWKVGFTHQMANLTTPSGPLDSEVTTTAAIQCVDMHTTGEPTRIVVSGYPSLQGTLAEQRVMAMSEHDHLRRRLILEPRGHHDLYGAVLRPDTELVEAGEADMGVLFMTNGGYSNMCGHATIALGRFLVDTHDPQTFPNRHALVADDKGTHLRLHVPCGVVVVTVQTLPDGRSDPTKPVAFTSVPSLATGIGVSITVPPERRWSVGKGVNEVTVDFTFAGAFFLVVRASGLYDEGVKQSLTGSDLKDLDEAAFSLIDLVNEDPRLRQYVTPESNANGYLGKLYAVVVVFQGLGQAACGTKGVETGVCFFDNHQIDRSPTGSTYWT